MSFIESYKHLEKLCGEILDDERCISAYIDEMENTDNGSWVVDGWNYDLKQLKHYRWIRNKIVHEPNCTEQNMCDSDDIAWIELFHSRIMNQSAPLALYLKATKSDPTPHNAKPSKSNHTLNNAKPSKFFLILSGFLAMLFVLLWILSRY